MLKLSIDFSVQQLLVAYGSALVTLLALDALWLALVMGPLYKSQLGELMLAQPRVVPAVVFYLLYTVGVVVFGVLPALRQQSWLCALLLSGLLGLVAYATYDLTNLSTLKGWSISLALMDIGWGALLTAAGGTVSYFAAGRLS